MAPPPVPERTPCSTLAEWNQHVKDAMLVIDQTETEENWDRMERAFLILASVVRGGAYKLDADFVPGVRTISRQTTTAMLSDRSRLSGTAIELLTVIGARMGLKFEPLVPLFIPALLKLCTRSAKIYVSRAQNSLKLFAAYCRVPSLVVLLKEAITDKSVTLRFAATDALHDLLSTSVRDGLPKRGKWVEDVEHIIKTTARDANPETRKMSRRVFVSYAQLWPERVNDFTRPLTPVTRRYLDVNDTAKTEPSRPRAQSHASAPAARSQSPTLVRKKSTVSIASRPTHTRTASENPAPDLFPPPAQQPPAPRLRSVRSGHFRAATQPVTKPVAARPPSREQRPASREQRPASREEFQPPQIERLAYTASSSRSVSSERHERPPNSSRSMRDAHLAAQAAAASQQAATEPPAQATTRSTLPHAVSSTPSAGFSRVERPAPSPVPQYPFATTGFVPKSRRQREAEAEAAQIPLPPSPKFTSSHDLPDEPPALALPPVSTRPVSVEPPQPTSATSTIFDAPLSSAQAQINASSRSVSAATSERKRAAAAPVIADKIKPSFRPRRGGAEATPSSAQQQQQPRKVSAFGAPAIITKVQPLPPPVPALPPAAPTSATAKNGESAPTNGKSRAGPQGLGRPQATASASSRSVSAHPSSTSASTQSTATATASKRADATTSSTVKPSGASMNRSRAISVSSKPTNANVMETEPPPKAAPRARNATGMTASQLAKQKPPVQRKLKSSKSVANLALGRPPVVTAPPVPRIPSKVIAASKGTAPAPALDVAAAAVPLPPSPALAPTEVVPPPSPELASASPAAAAPVAPAETEHTLKMKPSFPTIESIKERLSDVLGAVAEVAASNDAVLAASAAVPEPSAAPVTVAVIATAAPETKEEEEPEFTLSDLEVPPPTMATTLASELAAVNDAVENVDNADDDMSYEDFEAVEGLGQSQFGASIVPQEQEEVLAEAVIEAVTVPTSRAASPVKIIDGEKHHAREGRVALGDVGMNVVEI